MEEEYIDIHYSARSYQLALDRFTADTSISDRNRELVQSFLRDAALGKTVIGKAKKKIGYSRLTNYLKHLRPFIEFVRKDIDSLIQEDMERFIEALEMNRIRSQQIRIVGNKRRESGAALSPGYKVDIKITIKKFYKWLWAQNRVYPDIVAWIDTFVPLTTLPALTEQEVARMVDLSGKLRQKAIIQVLFDGGLRIGELLNVRLKHVTLRQIDPADPSKVCFFLRAPYSKTMPRTVSLPMPASTKWLRLWLEQHPANPMIRPDGVLETSDPTSQLFPMTESCLRHAVNAAGRRALGKRVYPHLLRHASATFWSNKLPHFKFCKRFGWSMTSKMPQRYIDREGVDEMDVAMIYYTTQSTD